MITEIGRKSYKQDEKKFDSLHTKNISNVLVAKKRSKYLHKPTGISSRTGYHT